MTTRVANNRLI